MKEHGVYKFVLKDTKEIVYIGKTNSSFQQRIDAHIRAKEGDDKFKDYAYKCDIYVAKLPNSTETDLIERALINQYKPILNGTDNHKGMSQLIKIDEPKWEIYIDKQRNVKKKNMPDIRLEYRFGFVGNIESHSGYLYMSHFELCPHLLNTTNKRIEFLKYILKMCKSGKQDNRGNVWVECGRFYGTIEQLVKYNVIKEIALVAVDSRNKLRPSNFYYLVLDIMEDDKGEANFVFDGITVRILENCLPEILKK